MTQNIVTKWLAMLHILLVPSSHLGSDPALQSSLWFSFNSLKKHGYDTLK